MEIAKKFIQILEELKSETGEHLGKPELLA